MAVLNIFAAAVDVLSEPSGLPWEWLILQVFAFVTNYGWRIILFTVCLKLLLLPLDVMQKMTMRRNQKITERIKPEIETLEKHYANDRNTFAQKQMELQRRNGYSFFKPCLPMIVTLVIFIWFFSSMTNIGQYMSMRQYLELYDVYSVAYDQAYATHDVPGANKELFLPLCIEAGQDAVVEYYDQKFGDYRFLWIRNMWSPDVAWTTPIKNRDDFVNSVGDYKSKVDAADTKYLAEYNNVTAKLTANSEPNGYFVLVVLAVVLSLLSQMIVQRQQRASGMNMNAPGSANMASTMKVMMVMMPLLLGYFAMTSTSVFALYLIVNSSMTLLINLTSTAIVKFIEKRNDRIEATTVLKYGRPDPNAR